MGGKIQLKNKQNCLFVLLSSSFSFDSMVQFDCFFFFFYDVFILLLFIYVFILVFIAHINFGIIHNSLSVDSRLISTYFDHWQFSTFLTSKNLFLYLALLQNMIHKLICINHIPNMKNDNFLNNSCLLKKWFYNIKIIIKHIFSVF